MADHSDFSPADKRALEIGLARDHGSRIHRKLESVRTGAARYADVTVSSAELLALNATPKTLVAAPGAGKFLDLVGMTVLYAAGNTAYTGVAAGEDFAVKFTDDSGEEVARMETTGMIDQATDQLRHVQGPGAKDAVADYTPVANAPLVLHLLVGEVADGDGTLTVRTYYRELSSLA